jgi:hypothetical protein
MLLVQHLAVLHDNEAVGGVGEFLADHFIQLTTESQQAEVK